MDTIQKTISNLIPEQFPGVYREHAPVFVLFVQKYYEWLQSADQQLYRSRRFMEYKDIDETTEEFLVYFKEKYLKNIQLDTVPNTRLLVKHSLDLYRSKGSERSIELLFRIAFGVSPKIYYPRSDLFKPSDGVWFKPKYLEVTLNENNTSYVNKQIKGVKSEALAFVDSVIRKTIDGTLKDLFYVSSITGTFLRGEKLVLSSNTIVHANSPSIVGSLQNLELDVNGSGYGFEVGDLVDIESALGRDALGRVAAVANATGVVFANVANGGYGYTANSVVLVSDKMLTIGETTTNLIMFETIYQPLANLVYTNSNGVFTNDEIITAYYSNGTTTGTGRIITAYESSDTDGELFVETLTGSLDANVIMTSGNTIAANLSSLGGYTDKTASGNVMHLDIDKIYLHSVNNEFIANAYWHSNTTLQTGTTNTVSIGSGLAANISSDLLYSEYVLIGNDYVSDYLSTDLNTTYNFPAMASANLDTIIDDALTYANTEIGKISALTSFNPGSNYNFIPIIKIYEEISYPFRKRDYILKIANNTALYQAGEVITQADTNARALVISSNSSVIYAENLRFDPENSFIQTINATTRVVGESSNAQANVTQILVNEDSGYMGFNANIDVTVTSANGIVTDLEIMDSGFGFSNGEMVTFIKGENEGTALAITGGIGQGNGYFKQKGGFLSDQKKLFDGYYWQNYSYDIKSPLTVDKYGEILKSVVHMAGYKFFGTTQYQTNVSSNINQANSRIVIT